MIAASLIATISTEDEDVFLAERDSEAEHESGEMAESKQYLNGELGTSAIGDKQAEDGLYRQRADVQASTKPFCSWFPF